ncbi:MAG: hypothetical protein J7L23_02965 [Candidatus Diapherotrites archaeon]|nr:hypothetical protein [Candidatus Diapherotrites archaeon]
MAKAIHIAILLILIAVIIGLVAYPSLGLANKPVLELSFSSPVGLGFMNISVKSNKPLKKLSVDVGSRPAEFVSLEGDTYTYRYFVSPYDSRDPLGENEITAMAVDADGNVINATSKLNISYFAIGQKVNGVIYYYPATPPSRENPYKNYTKPTTIVSNILSNRTVSFFFEMDEGGSKRNSQVISALQPLVKKLTSLGINVSSYAIDVRKGKWVDCIDTNGSMIPLAECEEKAFNTPAIILRLPVYPTPQVLLTNSTIDMQPAVSGPKETVDSLVALLGTKWSFQTNNSVQ